jgi:hypothetical protein
MSSQMSQLCHIQEDINPSKLDFAAHLQQQLHQLSSINFIYMQLSYGTEPATKIRAEFLCGRQQMGCLQSTLCISVHSYITQMAFLFLGTCTQFQKAKISFKMSVCPHGTTRLPLYGYSRSFIFKDFFKIYRRNRSFIKILQEQRGIYMKTYVHLWQ